MKTIDSTIYPCLGALIGDTVGSIYEFDNTKKTDFPFFCSESIFTDDSVMTIAVADWFANTDRSQESLEQKFVDWGNKYRNPEGGYGSMFYNWLFFPKNGVRQPYNSWGNGSAMRVSACGWAAKTLDEALELAKQSAQITHNHPEGIKGAQATATAIFLALSGKTKDEIRDYVEKEFGYNLHRTCDEIREVYKWDGSCQGTVPEAICAFLDSADFESAIRLAVSLGGDSDTLACITGGIAQAFYKDIPEYIIAEMKGRLPRGFWQVMKQLRNEIN